MNVFQHQHQRLLTGQRLEEASRRSEYLSTQRLRVQMPHPLRELSRDLEPHHRRQIGQRLRNLAFEERIEPPLQTGPGDTLVVGFANTSRLPQDLEEGPVAQLRAVGEGPSLEPQQLLVFL